eukprot:jgi/Chlat1/7087/Chrsp57S06779
MGDLSGVLARLEVVATRLESLEGRLAVGGGEAGGAAAAAGQQGAVTSKQQQQGGSVGAFGGLLQNELAAVSAAGEKIGGEVVTASNAVREAFEAQATVVSAMAACKQPEVAALQSLLAPLAERIHAVTALAEGRRTASFNNLKTAAEAVGALYWVAYAGKDSGMSIPPVHVEESWQAAEFYANKVLMEHRGKDDNHLDWVKALKALFFALRDYLKRWHTTAPAWNANGKPLEFWQKEGGTAKPSAASGAPSPAPPPPPPPPPPPLSLPPMPSSSSDKGQGSSMDFVFAELNKGESVTSGLRKVTDDMKTKNRSDRSGAVPSTVAAASIATTATTVNASTMRSPVLELQGGRKWVVEHHVDNRNITLPNVDSKQSVYIYGCTNSVVSISGKVNNIIIDSCKRTGVVCQDVVASCEVINSAGIELQTEGNVPSIAVDNCAGCQLYLSKASLSAAITTAKSSAVNVLVPGPTDDSDMVEHAIPEQFVSTLSKGQLVTMPVSHSGG